MERFGNILKNPKAISTLTLALACVALGSEKIAPTPACNTEIAKPKTYACPIDNLGRAVVYVYYENKMPWEEQDFTSQQHEN